MPDHRHTAEASIARRPSSKRHRWRVFALIASCTLGLSLAGAGVHADSYDDRRVRTGARLFRSLLAADVALERKIGTDGRLHVLVYADDADVAAEVARLIAPADTDQGAVRGLPVSVGIVEELPSVDSAAPVGLFLATAPAAADLDRLIGWGIAEGVILYSPFEGHVERGVLAGLSIEARVRPFLNQRTLDASGIALKPFYLRVAKVHP